jgi:hypothetical protein
MQIVLYVRFVPFYGVVHFSTYCSPHGTIRFSMLVLHCEVQFFLVFLSFLSLRFFSLCNVSLILFSLVLSLSHEEPVCMRPRCFL